MRRDHYPRGACCNGSGLPNPVKGVRMMSAIRVDIFSVLPGSVLFRKARSSRAVLEKTRFTAFSDPPKLPALPGRRQYPPDLRANVRHWPDYDGKAVFVLVRLTCSLFVTTFAEEVHIMNIATQNTYVRARIDAVTKERAVDALADMGLSVSDAIRLLLIRVADERRLPFEVKAPSETTRRAIEELEAGGGQKFHSVAEMIAALDAND
jgi:DNA-damage-inducible protein J